MILGSMDMSTGYPKNHRSGSNASPGIGWSLGLIICLVAVVLALPALAVGMVLQRLTSARPWSFPLWFALTLAGVGLVSYLSTHARDRMIAAQPMDCVPALQ